MGFFGIKLFKEGSLVEGWVFSLDEFGFYWIRLDVFEGDVYLRVLIEVMIFD